MRKEEILLRFNLLERQSSQIEENLQAIDSKMLDLNEFQDNLDKLSKSKEKNILTNLGEGIFIKSEIKEEKVLVNIGSKILIKKDISEARGIINSQIQRLLSLKSDLLSSLEKVNLELQKIVQEAQAMS